MYTCSLCRLSVPLDDTLVATARGTCICLGCYLRHVDDRRGITRELRRQVAEATADP